MTDGDQTSVPTPRGVEVLLAGPLGVGLVVFGSDGKLELANHEASRILDCPGSNEFDECWTRVARALTEAAAKPGQESSGTTTTVDLNLPVNGVARPIAFEVYRLERPQTSAFVALVRDKQRFESLEADLGLATRMRSLAYVSGAVVHDLKTPLNAMVFNVELLRQSLEKSPTVDAEVRASQKRYLETLQAEILRLDRSLNSVLGQYMFRAGPRDVDLRDLVRDVATVVAAQARQQKVEFTVRIPDEPMRVTAARDLFQSAVLNVAINALEAMPSAGQLTIDLAILDGEARLSIRDSGPGIPVGILDKIGEVPFSTKERRAGIGLCVARACVESWGGRLSVESKLGEGACVYVTVPLAANEELRTHAIRTSSRRRS